MSQAHFTSLDYAQLRHNVSGGAPMPPMTVRPLDDDPAGRAPLNELADEVLRLSSENAMLRAFIAIEHRGNWPARVNVVEIEGLPRLMVVTDNDQVVSVSVIATPEIGQ